MDYGFKYKKYNALDNAIYILNAKGKVSICDTQTTQCIKTQ